MRNTFLLLCFCVLMSTGCSKADKGCKSVDPQTEEAQILAFAAANGIYAPMKHSSGIYYKVVNEGSGPNPTATSWVSVNYTGKLLNGSIFEKSTTSEGFKLQDVIEGWQLGLPLIKKSGTIKLIIPSAYAYGCNGKSNIPPNSVLYFEVQLIDVR